MRKVRLKKQRTEDQQKSTRNVLYELVQMHDRKRFGRNNKKAILIKSYKVEEGHDCLRSVGTSQIKEEFIF